MVLSRNDPFRALFELQRAMDSRLKSDWFGRSTAGRGSFPPINIFEKDGDYIAVVELPGIEKADLDIQVKSDHIRLSGKKTPEYPEGASSHRRERVFGTFDRTISVPIKIDADRVNAAYHDGLLALHIPRAEDDKPRKVDIG